MPSSQSDWDAKHRLAAETPPSEPASIVRELLPLLPAGPALDIACGTGRHSLLLSARGQHVTAVDFSSVALGILEARARSMSAPVRRGQGLCEAGRPQKGGLELIHADLERIDKGAYDELMTAGLRAQHSAQRIIGELLLAQLADNRARSTAYRMGVARFPVMKNLAEFDFCWRGLPSTPQPRSGNRLSRHLV